MYSDVLEQVMLDLDQAETLRYAGRVTRVVGMLVEGVMPSARIGATCRLEPTGSPPVLAEVVGLREGRAILMPLGSRRGLTVGTAITMSGLDGTVAVGPSCLGRVLNGLGEPIDGGPPLGETHRVSLIGQPINPLSRQGISRPMDMGVRALNGLLTIGEGQRMAVLAAAGVGKSTLLGMVARNTEADVTVIGLIGERGREVQEFVENDLRIAATGASRAVVVAATSDESPALRLRAAFTATAIAEYFANTGLRVLLLMDSLTRVVMAQREIGLSIGEPPATRGYPPSAFALIPQLLERAGVGRHGSVTAMYTTLIEGDDPEDPIADAVRGTTDGHILLSRKLAEGGQYPAIDVTRSISRVMRFVTTKQHMESAQRFRVLLNDFQAADELVSLGAYRQGSNPRYDHALKMVPLLRQFIIQDPDDQISMHESFQGLQQVLLAEKNEDPMPRNAARPNPARPYK